MPKCKSVIASDDPTVKFDVSHHIARGKAFPSKLRCVLPEGHTSPQHHASETATWDNLPGTDRDMTADSPADQREG